MLVRQTNTDGGKESNKLQRIDESITLAKRAIRLGPSNHRAWYTLGNAYCFRFFGNPSPDAADLDAALVAYKFDFISTIWMTILILFLGERK